MCGIAGALVRRADVSAERLGAVAQAMSDTLAHRGPDDAGVWVDAAAGVALGHRRLSILDLSPLGHQPMLSEDGRFVLTYNGEIYNFRELRGPLEGAGHKFRGGSDTEVLLAAIAAWGVEETLRRSVGMFAFGLWDRERRTLTLARDRAGKKPLYYGRAGDAIVFGSELKALRAYPDFDAAIDRDALGLFLRYGWVPAPLSIHRDVRKLPAASWLTLDASSDLAAVAPQSYWSAREVAERGAREPFRGSFEEATDALEALLRDAVRVRMISDVSLGALLSGGVDSSTVVALMREQSAQPVRTFAIGFREPRFDEAGHARAIAAHLGTDHTELYVTADDALALVPRLPSLYDEPFADSSQIPTFLVSELARRHVTVALSGDGGDELFAGYTSYADALKRWRKLARTPLALRRATTGAARAAGRLGWTLAGGPRAGRRSWFAKLEKRARHWPARDAVDLFVRKKSHVPDVAELVRGAREIETLLTSPAGRPAFGDPVQSMLTLDFATYLCDDILVKVDRASMGVSLEVRCPILDHRVVELAWSLPMEMRFGGGGKRVLKSVLERHVPRALFDRPKAGFSVPVEEWLRGPLREWAGDLLAERALSAHGLLDASGVRRVYEQHQAGWLNHDQLLWNLLVFQGWYAATRAAAPAR